MKIVDHKIDNAVQAYWKRWLDSLDRPRAAVILANFVITFVTLFWSASITTQLGYELKKGVGTLIFIGIWLLISLVILGTSRLMTLLGIEAGIRSALLLAGIVGPYINLVAFRAWELATLSHILGFAGSILTFVFTLLLDKTLNRMTAKAS